MTQDLPVKNMSLLELLKAVTIAPDDQPKHETHEPNESERDASKKEPRDVLAELTAVDL